MTLIFRRSSGCSGFSSWAGLLLVSSSFPTSSTGEYSSLIGQCILILISDWSLITCRIHYENELCWMDHGQSLIFLALPVISVIFINIFFLTSVILVLRRKFQFQNKFNRNNDVTFKSAKAVIILVPIFGLHFLLMPMRPEAGSIFEYIYEVKTIGGII